MPITRFLLDPEDGTFAGIKGAKQSETPNPNDGDTSNTSGGSDEGAPPEDTPTPEEKQKLAQQTIDNIESEKFTFFITSLNSAHSRHKRIKVVGSIESYSDSFSVTTTSDNAYGRIDPIYTYTGTTRTISFSVLMDTTLSERNVTQTGMDTAKKIAAILYPSYSDSMGVALDSSTLKAPPLVKIEWEGMINNTIGYITSFSYDVNTRRGTTLILNADGELESQPAGVTLNITFQPIHTKEGGFGPTGIQKTTNWPI